MSGVTRNHIARLHVDGSLDTAFNPNVNSRVDTLALQPNGKILIGGDFTSVSGVARNSIARLEPTGLLDTSFTANVQGIVEALLLQSDGKIVL